MSHGPRGRVAQGLAKPRLAGSLQQRSELVNFSVTPAEEGASGFVTAVAAR